MDVREMHYEFKLKLNKIDSNDYSNIIIPEVDWYLNEAQDIFVKQRYGISNAKRQGFEVTQKRIDDLKMLVVKGFIPPAPIISQADTNTYEICLPENYLFLIRSKVDISKLDGSCPMKMDVGIIQVQHDDLNNITGDPFYSPSYEWEEVPAVFMGPEVGWQACCEDTASNYTPGCITDPNCTCNPVICMMITGVPAGGAPDSPPNARCPLGRFIMYTDGTFGIMNAKLDYIRKPQLISYGSGVSGASYNYPSGVVAPLLQHCELSIHTHREIVDIAVQIASGDLDHPNFQVKALKTQLNE